MKQLRSQYAVKHETIERLTSKHTNATTWNTMLKVCCPHFSVPNHWKVSYSIWAHFGKNIADALQNGIMQI